MSESTLSLTYDTIRAEIGDYLGIGRAYGSWSATNTSRVDSIIASGLRQFYFPQSGYRWSFLTPAATLTIGPTSGTVSGVPVYDGTTYSTITATSSIFKSRMASFDTTITFGTSDTEYTIASYTSATVVKVLGNASGEATGDTIEISGQQDYDLPDDFGAIVGNMTFAASDSCLYPSIKLTSEYNIRVMRQDDVSSLSYPAYVAIRAVANAGTSGQRYEAMFSPAPTAEYTLDYKYTVLPNTIGSTATYPLGGALHAETILASCMSVAEERLNDTAGLKRQLFNERLQVSMTLDAKAGADYLGYNGDNSDNTSVDNSFSRVNSVTYVNN